MSEFSLPQPAPKYVSAHSGNVTAVLGKNAILNCRVEGVGNRTVSDVKHFPHYAPNYSCFVDITFALP